MKNHIKNKALINFKIMAKQTNNVVTHGLSGKVGDLLVFRQRAGKTVVGKAPVSRFIIKK